MQELAAVDSGTGISRDWGMPADGSINYAVLSNAQLLEALASIDRHSYPLNLANLTAEMASRGLHAPSPTPRSPIGLVAAAKGQVRLWEVYWLYSLVASVCLGVLDWVLPDDGPGRWLFWTVTALASAFWFFCVWKCAPNCGSPTMTLLVRINVVVAIVVLGILALV